MEKNELRHIIEDKYNLEIIEKIIQRKKRLRKEKARPIFYRDKGRYD